MINTFWASLVGAFLLLTTPVLAQEACQPLEQTLARIEQIVPIELTIKLDAPQTARVVAWFNSLPPEGEENYNLAILVKHKDNQLGLLLGNDGNICVGALVPGEMVRDLMKAIAGGEGV